MPAVEPLYRDAPKAPETAQITKWIGNKCQLFKLLILMALR
jgi:hypothetical protein